MHCCASSESCGTIRNAILSFFRCQHAGFVCFKHNALSPNAIIQYVKRRQHLSPTMILRYRLQAHKTKVIIASLERELPELYTLTTVECMKAIKHQVECASREYTTSVCPVRSIFFLLVPRNLQLINSDKSKHTLDLCILLSTYIQGRAVISWKICSLQKVRYRFLSIA